MPKHIEDMIVPERRRSIRDIPIPEGRRKKYGYTTETTREEINILREKPVALRPSFSQIGSSRKKLWIVTGVAILLLVFATLSLFSGATLSYVPKSTPITFDNNTFSARKTGEEGLLFSVIKFSKDKGQEIAASGVEEVKRKASGNIVVYNTSSKEQKFRATTRFAPPDGKTYQVQDAISIPAKKIVGGVNKPGTLEIKVYSEFPGAEFNIGLSDFTLPGLKGTALSSSIYARSKTEMSGGFVGVEKIVNQDDEAQAKATLETTLREELISEAEAQVPEDFILLPSLSVIAFEDLPQTESTSKGRVMINRRSNLQGIMFKRADLSTYLAGKKVTVAPHEIVDLSDTSSLNFAFADTHVLDLSSLDEIKFTVQGTITAIWRIDEVALKADLVGKSKRDLYSILSNYPTVVSATATIRPFWKNYFPSDSAKILMKKLPVN